MLWKYWYPPHKIHIFKFQWWIGWEEAMYHISYFSWNHFFYIRLLNNVSMKFWISIKLANSLFFITMPLFRDNPPVTVIFTPNDNLKTRLKYQTQIIKSLWNSQQGIAERTQKKKSMIKQPLTSLFIEQYKCPWPTKNKINK